MKPGAAMERARAGAGLEARGDTLGAEAAYRAALRIDPRERTALARLGLLLGKRGELAKAAGLFRRWALAHPGDAAAWENLGAALLRQDDMDGAAEAYETALTVNPASLNARMNAGLCHLARNRLDESRRHYQAVVDADARQGLARWNLACLDALAGDLDAAFAGFAHPLAMRWTPRPAGVPLWDGAPLGGRTLVMQADQGLGDTLMFARLASLARARGARVVLRTQPALTSLLARAELADACESADAPLAADAWCALAEAPAILGARACLAAAPGPYLTADPRRMAAWSERLGGTGMTVGLVWAGSPDHPQDARRSLPVRILLEALAGLDGVRLISLQKGPAAAQADGSPLVRADREIGDFEDTAAILARIDLLVSVDTSVLHLAGALGRPAWGLLAFAPDWRWMLGRDDSPWYPSLRLFRQPRPGDWAGAARAVATALRERLAGRGD